MPIAEGRQFEFDTESAIRTDYLETIFYDGHKQRVTYDTREFSCVCPFSGLPDYGRLIMDYVPDKHIVELKSLKYYIVSFRNVGMYQEAVTNRICADIYTKLNPHYLKITTIYNTRGGIDTTCIMEKGANTL